jgi:S1-C subfamily serine protease
MRKQTIIKSMTLGVAALSISCVAFAGVFSSAMKNENDLSMIVARQFFLLGLVDAPEAPQKQQAAYISEATARRVMDATVLIESTWGNQSLNPDGWSSRVVMAALDGFRLLGLDREGVSGVGTGVQIGGNGDILTASHVVFGAKKIRVKSGDQWHDAELINLDGAGDLAVIRASSLAGREGLFLAKETPQPGEMLYSYGFGDSDALTHRQGAFASIERERGAPFAAVWADCRHGDSGGAVVNYRGELVGINSQGGASANLMFAGLVAGREDHILHLSKATQ